MIKWNNQINQGDHKNRLYKDRSAYFLLVVTLTFTPIPSSPTKKAIKVSQTTSHVCALFDNGAIDCWTEHWILENGDSIRKYSSLGFDEVFLKECKQRADDVRACQQAFKRQPLCTLTLQGDGTTYRFGLLQENGKWVISDIAFGSQCDL